MKWEYKSETMSAVLPDTVPFPERLRLLGDEGWEMCGVIGNTISAIYFFKRPKKDQS